MTYRINYSDDIKTPIIVQDGDIDTTTDLGIVGRGYTGFGEVIAENFLHLLENFSDETPPTRPIEGQLWYNNAASALYYYTVAETWKKVGNTRAETYNPILGQGEVNGDMWLNTTTNDVYMYISPNWTVIANGDSSTKIYARTRKDSGSPILTHKTLEYAIDNKVVAIFSGDAVSWNPNSTGSTTEFLDDGTPMVDTFPVINLGINLINRKNITEVTVSSSNPDTLNVYLVEGDLWVNKNTKKLYCYNGENWDRIGDSVKVRDYDPVIENDEEIGDIWINSATDKIYYYDSVNVRWQLLGQGTTLSTVSPTFTDIKNLGDYWINTSTLQLFVYNGTSWLNLSFQEKGTFVMSNTRLDDNNIPHKTLETIINNVTVKVQIGDDFEWNPNVSEILYEGGSFAAKFPTLYPETNGDGYIRGIDIAGDVVATVSEVIAGTANNKVVTPETLQAKIDELGLEDADANKYLPVTQFRSFPTPLVVTFASGTGGLLKVGSLTIPTVGGNAVEFDIKHQGIISTIAEGNNPFILYTIKKNGANIITDQLFYQYGTGPYGVPLNNPILPVIYSGANAKNDVYELHIKLDQTSAPYTYTIYSLTFKAMLVELQAFTE